MSDANPESSERRAKCLAYGLLVVAAITFTFEMGRQRGAADAHRDALEQEDERVALMGRSNEEPGRPWARQYADATAANR